jgi:pimeloyl-ACP methyl ester carboxylesterase
MSLLSSFLAILLSLQTPDTRGECQSDGGLSWCTYSGAKDRVIYYFHGFGNDFTAWFWNPVVKRFRRQWKDNGLLSPPSVVSISFGTGWLMVPKSKIEQDTLWSRITTLEKDLKLEHPKRILVGDSMGGNNALQLLSLHPQAFSKIAVYCPALLTQNPFSSSLSQSHLLEPLVRRFFKDKYETEESFRTLNPLVRLQGVSKASLAPELSAYVGYLINDQLGFTAGPRNLSRVLREKGVPVVEEEAHGIHCNFRSEKMALFVYD